MKAVRARRRYRALVHTIIATLVVLVFAFVEWWAEKTVAQHSRLASTIIEVATVLIVALAFRPIHQRVERAIEAAFTKKKREAQAALLRLRAELTSYNDATQLLRRVVEGVQHHMDAAGCAVYVRREMYRAEASSFDFAAPPVELNDALAVRLRSTATPAKPALLQSRAAGSVAFPMTVAGDLIGFLSISAHDEFEPDEQQLLASFAESVGLALVALDPHLRAGAAAHPAHNLPTGLAPLSGRDEDLFEIKTLMRRSRLVTIVGPGGIGKTRIACQAASDMIPDDGAWFVDLAPIANPDLVASAIARTFNIADEGGSHPLIETVARALTHKHLLIVLDNCEHVVAAAAHAASHLLKTCPNVSVLATSREALGIAGEEPYRLPSLSVPEEGQVLTAETLMQYGAAALFVERAHSAQRSFTVTDENAATIGDIVRRLDGIALAIELAARRINVLTLAELDRRLDERFALLRGGSRVAQPRHQTLHALIGWSYDLLTPGEQRLLRRSALFRASWTFDALEALCDSGEERQRAFDDLAALVDKSLVVVDAGDEERRYRLLESTQAFALERLNAAGERHVTAARHCAFFEQLAIMRGDTYWETDSGVWSKNVSRDLENIRAAIGWGLHEDHAAAITMIAELRWYWYLASRREGRTLLERAHELRTDALSSQLCGLLALAAATLDYSAQAVLPASEAARALAGVDALGYAEALTFEGIALGRGGRIPDAIRIFEDAILQARSTGIPRFVGWVLSMVAYWMSAARNDARARGLFDEAAELLRSCNDAWQLARLQLHRAEFLFAQGDPDGALASVREAEAVFRERHGESGLCVCMLNAAAYLIALARLDEAWTCAREGLELSLRLETSMPGAWAFGHLARLAAENGDSERAARLLGYADAAYAATGSAREPTEQSGYDRTMERVRASLPEERIKELQAEGAALEQEAAVAHARAVAQPSSYRVVPAR